MPNQTYTSETPPSEERGGSGTRWYKSSTHQWYSWSGGAWVLAQDGFDAVKVADLEITGSCTSGGDAGITGEYEGTFKKVKIENGIITEFEIE